MNIVFMGTPDYATEIFKAMVESGEFKPVLLITQEDKPVGRKQLLTPPHIKKWLLDSKESIDIYQPKSLRDKSVVDKIASYKPDIIVVAAYGKILPKEILDLAPCVNLHASILPYYRGASPIQSAILNQDRYSGVTAMMMEEGLDCGDILAFRYISLEGKRVDEAFKELSLAAASLNIEVLKNFETLQPVKQIDCDATFCVKIKKENGLVDFEMSAYDIYVKYLAYTPWPGIFLPNGLKLKEVELYEKEGSFESFGLIEDITKDGILITCKEGLLKLKKLQAPSKKEVDAVDYIKGKRLKIGDKLV